MVTVVHLIKTTHETMNMWSYIAGGPKIKVILRTVWRFGIKSSGLIIKGDLQMKGCENEGSLSAIFAGYGNHSVRVELLGILCCNS